MIMCSYFNNLFYVTALKVILVCFERQLGSEWYQLSLQVKEMALRKVGGLALWDFLDFIVRTRIPIFVLLRPFIQCKVSIISKVLYYTIVFAGILQTKTSCSKQQH